MRAAGPDTTRIAIFPFRVTAADTMLGEGFAELLSSEFPGGRGPRAVHMSNVIRAWRNAGGGVRAPLTQPVAARTARQVGAGLYIDGSVVGLGNRLTVTALVVSAVDGQVRRAEPIRGSADSLDVLLSRVAATLVALAGGEAREGSRGVLTGSPAAMRAYVEGVAFWRRYRVAEANAAFERALREDSLFARAVLMRYWSANFVGGNTTQWGSRLFALRDRLSTADRVLVTALLGDNYPMPRLPAQSFRDRERAAAELPESPEAQYLAGDWLFHYGGAIDATDWAERSRGYFAASFALDSQTTVLGHLVDVAMLLGDTSLLRSLRPVLEPRIVDMWGPNFNAAGYLGDRAWLARLPLNVGDSWGVSMMEANTLVPAATFEEAISREPDQRAVNGARAFVAYIQGRPEAQRRASEGLPDDPFMITATVVQSLFGIGDTASAAALLRRYETLPLQGEAAEERDCVAALWRAWWQDNAPERALSSRDGLRNCVTMVELVRAWRRGAPDLGERLAAADSTIRGRLSPLRYQGYENWVLSRIWLSQGDRGRALSAIRLYPVGFRQLIGMAERLREEGRLAAELGQVDRAIAAYRRYLDYRKDAEPSLIPQRDSVRAAMLRLVSP